MGEIDYVAGIDVGSTTVKVAVVDPATHEIVFSAKSFLV